MLSIQNLLDSDSDNEKGAD